MQTGPEALMRMGTAVLGVVSIPWVRQSVKEVRKKKREGKFLRKPLKGPGRGTKMRRMVSSTHDDDVKLPPAGIHLVG